MCCSFLEQCINSQKNSLLCSTPLNKKKNGEYLKTMSSAGLTGTDVIRQAQDTVGTAKKFPVSNF